MNQIILSILGIAILMILIATWGSGIIIHTSYHVPLTITPNQFQLGHEPIEFATQDGLLIRGWFIPAASPTLKTVILLHGWGDNKGTILPDTHFLHQNPGLNLVYFDFRACGESQGKVSSIGYLETIDFSAAMDFLKQHKSDLLNHLGVYGRSMGGAVAIWAAARYTNLKAVIAESSFASYTQMVTYYTWHKLYVPVFPLVPLVLQAAKMRLGADPEPYSPFYHVDKISPRPILFIHGEKDTYTLPETSKVLHEKAREPKEIWIVPQATHAKCAEASGEEYQRRISSFFNKYL